MSSNPASDACRECVFRKALYSSVPNFLLPNVVTKIKQVD